MEVSMYNKNIGVVLAASTFSGLILNCKMKKDDLLTKKNKFKNEKIKILNSEVGQYLQKNHFFNYESRIKDILESMKIYARNTFAGKGGSDKFGFDSSCIYIDEKLACLQESLDDSYQRIAIDVGGTYTKVVVRNSEETTLLFNKDNFELMKNISETDENGYALKGFIRNLVSEIKSDLDKMNIGSGQKIKGIGIVWSNAINTGSANFQENGYNGISGIVKGIDDGSFYKKGEPFLKGLRDGFDVSKSFSDAFSLVFKDDFLGNVAIANDTIYTLKALNGASSGIVMSTGSNFTLVDREGIIYNAEGGATFYLDDSLLTKNENKFKERLLFDESKKLVPIQTICSGKWLGKIMEEYILDMDREGFGHFGRLAEDIRNYYQGNKKQDDINYQSFIRSSFITSTYAKVNSSIQGDNRYQDFISKYKEAREDFEILACALIRRAIHSCALFSVVSCERENEDFDVKKQVALDSTIIRFSNSLDILNEIVDELSFGKISVKLIMPIIDKNGHEISVPLQGALHTI